MKQRTMQKESATLKFFSDDVDDFKINYFCRINNICKYCNVIPESISAALKESSKKNFRSEK